MNKPMSVFRNEDKFESSEFERVRLNDVTVHMMVGNGSSLELIVIQLAKEKEQYLKRIMELESIAPRKIVMPDGKVMIWHCPDHLVPEI